ncbi:MarR family winged helix-turn-helix transcriptional regulator [Gellertiella hungarica]|uniref:DNA-binding MarR family transcriptional regulator n=1 Tax=Gellertiella hungarica TaxID=1572859 RepID=A0A7W6NLW9_9HYPH|nr:MarR family transcriptional regulator [Gellertiella hungarica]MBB4065767.1 DNA-binding MarR family transcriptional regulator [Gellertiella hungarica]
MSSRENPPPPIPFSTTLHVRDHCLCFQAQRAARELARTFDLAFQPLGLTNGQFSLMMALNRPQPPALGQLAGELRVDRTTLTAAVKVLERRRLVAGSRDPENRRVQRLSLTPEGYALLQLALPIWERTLARIAGPALQDQSATGEALRSLADRAAAARA